MVGALRGPGDASIMLSRANGLCAFSTGVPGSASTLNVLPSFIRQHGPLATWKPETVVAYLKAEPSLHDVADKVAPVSPTSETTLKWHSPSASPDADVLAQLAYHFEVARDATEPHPIIGAHVPMSQEPYVQKIARLRWYDDAAQLVWDNWCGEEGRGVLPDAPPHGAMAWVFGMPGVGKTEWRNFMAIHILRNDDGGGIIVFDCAYGGDARVVLVRQVEGDDGSLRVQVAATLHPRAAKVAARAAQRVFHLLDCSYGLYVGYGLGHSPQSYFTVVTSSHDPALQKKANEWKKKTMLRCGGASVGTLILYAPPSTLAELLRVERICQSHGLSDDQVVAIVEKYGPVPRRLDDCKTAEQQAELDHVVDANAKLWCSKHTTPAGAIPSAHDIIAHVSDSLVVCWTSFDDEGATGAARFRLDVERVEWASNYVRHVVARAIHCRASKTLICLEASGATVPDVRGRLAKELMLTLFEVGNGQECVEVKHVAGPSGGIKGLDTLRGVTTCKVVWMRAGLEKKRFKVALAHVAHTGTPVLIRPFSHKYPGVDALLMVAAGDTILLQALQATVAAKHALCAGGLRILKLWQSLCTAHSVTFDSLVCLLPQRRYDAWKGQDGVPAELPQLAWTLKPQ